MCISSDENCFAHPSSLTFTVAGSSRFAPSALNIRPVHCHATWNSRYLRPELQRSVSAHIQLLEATPAYRSQLNIRLIVDTNIHHL
ncbi:hypothetical protein AHAS_Ahas05G0097300 [Arachis hypogaea]